MSVYQRTPAVTYHGFTLIFLFFPSSPEFLDKVVDPELEQWGRNLNELWKELCRKISDDVEKNPEKHSQIYVPNPVIVPGGRFR